MVREVVLTVMQQCLKVKGKETKVTQDVEEDKKEVGEEVGKDEARKVELQEKAIVQSAVEVEVKEVKEGKTLERSLLFLCCAFLL